MSHRFCHDCWWSFTESIYRFLLEVCASVKFMAPPVVVFYATETCSGQLALSSRHARSQSICTEQKMFHKVRSESCGSCAKRLSLVDWTCNSWCDWSTTICNEHAGCLKHYWYHALVRGVRADARVFACMCVLYLCTKGPLLGLHDRICGCFQACLKCTFRPSLKAAVFLDVCPMSLSCFCLSSSFWFISLSPPSLSLALCGAYSLRCLLQWTLPCWKGSSRQLELGARSGFPVLRRNSLALHACSLRCSSA